MRAVLVPGHVGDQPLRPKAPAGSGWLDQGRGLIVLVVDPVVDGPGADVEEVVEPTELVVEPGAVLVGSSSSGSEVVEHNGPAVVVTVDPRMVLVLPDSHVVVEVASVVVVLIGLLVVEFGGLVSGKVDGGTGPGPVLTVGAWVVTDVAVVSELGDRSVVVDVALSTVVATLVARTVVDLTAVVLAVDSPLVAVEGSGSPGDHTPSLLPVRILEDGGPVVSSSTDDAGAPVGCPAGDARSISLLASSA